MRHLFRQPITWMVLGEFVIVAALVAVSWHTMVSGAAGSAPLVLPGTSTPQNTGLQDTGLPDSAPGVLSPPSPSANPLLPGLNLDTGFWRARLNALNAAEAQLEALEWRIVHSAMDTIHRYVESVLVPELERAERRGGA